MKSVHYIEVILESDFNVLRETLTRIGIISENKVYQTCHLLHNNNKYYVVHFKELFSLYSFRTSGKIDVNKIHMDENDFYRRNSIIYLLKNWDLINLNEDVNKYINENKNDVKINVIPYKDRFDYEFITKFKLGNYSSDQQS